MFVINKHSFNQGPIKPRVGPGLDVHLGSYSKSPKNLNIFDELKYIMWTHKSVLVGYVSFESFQYLGENIFSYSFLPLL